MCSLRYLGVETTTGDYSLAACVVSTSKLGFEWCIHSADGIRHEIVTPLCKNAMLRGVPTPEFGRRVIVPVAHLEDAAAKAARHGEGLLREKLHREDLVVACRYLGVAVPDGFDKHAPALKNCKVGFEWVLAFPEWDWKEEVSMRVKDLVDKRDIPLPRCSYRGCTVARVAYAFFYPFLVLCCFATKPFYAFFYPFSTHFLPIFLPIILPIFFCIK